MNKCKICSTNTQEGDLCPRCKLAKQVQRAAKIDKALEVAKQVVPFVIMIITVIFTKRK